MCYPWGGGGAYGLSEHSDGGAGGEQGGREGGGGAGPRCRGVLVQVELAGVVPDVAPAQGLDGARVVREEAVLRAQPAERLELQQEDADANALSAEKVGNPFDSRLRCGGGRRRGARRSTSRPMDWPRFLQTSSRDSYDGLVAVKSVADKRALRRTRSTRTNTHLGVGQPDGVLEVDPGDHLRAGWCGERAVVREVVRAGAGDERGQGELAAETELGEGRLDLRKVVHHFGVHGVVRRHHLCEKRC